MTCKFWHLKLPSQFVAALRLHSGPLILLSFHASRWLKSWGSYSSGNKNPWEKPIQNDISLDQFALTAGLHPAEDPQASRASLETAWSSNGGIIAYGSRRVIASQRCSGPNLLVEPARHRLQSQKTVGDERQLWLWLIRPNHLSSDWWRGVWESSLSKFYLPCWLQYFLRSISSFAQNVRYDPFWHGHPFFIF